MSSDRLSSLHHRIRKTKAALLAVSFTLAGILLMMVNAWLTPMQLGDWQWLHAIPLGELGGTLLVRDCCRRSSSTPSSAIRSGPRPIASSSTSHVTSSGGSSPASWVCSCSAPASPGASAKKRWPTPPASPPTPTKSSRRASPAPAPPMNPRLRIVIALATALDMRVEELVGGLA